MCKKIVWWWSGIARRVTDGHWSSWFRIALLKDNIKATTADPSKANDPPPSSKKHSRLQKSDLEEHGITDKLVDLVRTFTVDTFKSFPLQDDGYEPGRDIESGATAAENAKRGMPILCWLESRWSLNGQSMFLPLKLSNCRKELELLVL